MDQVKSVTLRSGKVIEKPTLERCEKDDESISEGKEGVESEHCKEKTDSPPVLSFPYAMTKQRKVNHNSEILETFKQVRINIPLLDVIQVTIKLKLHWKIKRRLLSHVHLVLLHIKECLLHYITHQLHFKDTCLAYSVIWLNVFLRFLWMIFLFLMIHLMII